MPSPRTRPSLKAFLEDRRGNFGMMMGIAALVLVMACGFALNLAQIETTRSNLLGALDSAVTSTARDITTNAIPPEEARGRVEAFLLANGNRAFASEDTITLDRLTVDRERRTLQAEASVTVDLLFPLFGTSGKRVVTTRSAAVYSDRAIEIAMMLDVTGSMAGQKLRDLKAAATEAVSIFLDGQDPDKPRVRIALVPYANAVNAGRLAETSVFVERSMDDRKQAPGNEAPRAVAASRPDNCATERKGDHKFTDASPRIAMVNRDYLIDDFARDFRSRPCPAAAVRPLSADPDALRASIGSYVAEGGTGGHMGVQWTWYMLSKNWAPYLPATARPLDPAGRQKVAKYAILMTDGEFNLAYDGARRAGDVYGDDARDRSMPAAARLCAAMRAQGIEIFTIGFKLENRLSKDMMKECASPDAGNVRHYFEVSTGGGLKDAYREIAGNIERLALTE